MIIVFDLCFIMLNKDILFECGIYILEYFYVGFMCNYFNGS